MNIKLGIIIPTYDSLDTLRVLLKNIQDYTDGEYTVFVVEDGQKKETIEFLQTQRVVSLLHATNKGVSPSWNDGLKAAEKEGCTHFAFFNDDIEIPPDWWSKCRAMFEDKKIHLLSLVPHPDKIGYPFDSLHMTGWFFIIDRECLKRVGYFDEQFAPFCAEDDDYFERFKRSGLLRGQIELDVFHHHSRTLKKIPGEVFQRVKRENWLKFRKKYPNKRMPAL